MPERLRPSPTGSTSASASRATCRTSSSSRQPASRAPTCASAAGRGAALARRPRRWGPLPRRGRGRARGRGDARRRRRRPPLDRRRAGRRVGSPTASRATAAASCSATSTTRLAGRDRRDVLAVARRRLVRVRLSHHAGGPAARADHGSPRRGRQARTEPEGYWQRKLAEHPGLAARIEASPSGTKLRWTGETPRSSAHRPALAGRSRATPGTSRTRSPARACATRCMGRTLAEHVLPVLDDPVAVDCATRRGRPSATASACPPTTSRTPTRASSEPSPALCRAGARRRADEEPDLADLFGRARTPQEIAARCGSAARSVALLRGERSRRETLRCALRDVRTELGIAPRPRGPLPAPAWSRAPSIPAPRGPRRPPCTRPSGAAGTGGARSRPADPLAVAA